METVDAQTMSSLRATDVRTLCSYCWVSATTDELSVCECGVSFCRAHRGIHPKGAGHGTALAIGPQLKVKSSSLSDTCIAEIEREIKLISDTADIKDRIELLNQGETNCYHIYGSDLSGATQIDPKEKCEKCDFRKSLWVCFTCGFTGCSRKQVGIDGNSHSKEHYEETGHPIAVLVESISPDGTNDSYCYECGDFVVNHVLIKRIRPFLNGERRSFREMEVSAQRSVLSNEYGREGLAEFQANATDDAKEGGAAGENGGAEKPDVILSNYVGIKNMGNTCYISSVLQMMASSIFSQECTEHFESCKARPLDCLCCQAVRVLGALRARAPVPIFDMLKLIFKDLNVSEPGKQQDASEFLILLVDRLREHLPKAVSKIDYKIAVNKGCKCSGDEATIVSEECFLMVPYRNSVEDAVRAYFSGGAFECEDCKTTSNSSTSIKSSPEFLFILIKRFSNDGQKIAERIECNNELRIPGADGSEFKFTLNSVVCHCGNLSSVGHYVCLIRVEDKIVLIDDNDVRMGNNSMLENAYILCYSFDGRDGNTRSEEPN